MAEPELEEQSLDIFLPFDKIELYTDQQLPPEALNQQWVALEKVHGANFSFVCDGKQIFCCRRRDVLLDDDDFFNFQQVREKYKLALLDLFKQVKSKIQPNAQSITIYGELFGGLYPHKAVVDEGIPHVQKGVYYAPWIDFYAFDILVKLDNTTQPKQWLDYDQCIHLFEDFGLCYAKPIVMGTFHECVSFTIKNANSTIPAMLKLPPLKQNQMEGIIIKTVKPFLISDDSHARLIFKVKNRKFAEVNPRLKSKTKHEIEQQKKRNTGEKIWSDMERYLTHNRMCNCYSKMGKISAKNISKAQELFFQDTLDDFTSDYASIWKNVDSEKQKLLIAKLKAKCTNFVVNWVKENQ